MIMGIRILRRARTKYTHCLINLRTPLKTSLLYICLHTVIVLLAAYGADRLEILPPAGFLNPALDSPPFIAKFIKWDAHWYTYIAEQGYDSQNIVFFPLLIILIKALALTGVDYGVAGFVIANFFTFISYFVMYLVLSLDFSDQVTRRALLAYALMPMSFFLNSIYTEPLFLVFALACIYFARTNRWLLAAVCATLAALTRNLGIFLVIYMLFEQWQTCGRYVKTRLRLIALLLPPLGLLSFMAYNYWLVGTPLAFVEAQQGWGREFALPWLSIWRNFKLIYATLPYTEIGIIMDAALAIIVLMSHIYLTFSKQYKIRATYLIIGWLWFLIPLCSTSPLLPLYSFSRFALIIFPLYIFLAQVRSAYFYMYVIATTILLPLCTALFINWYWLG